jgi:predicted O-linked N-acetylglucosamine transferase (SPINDLY family)
MGSTFAGRVAASLLHAVDVPELITGSLGAYEALALKFARDGAALKAIKAKLASNRDRQPLFDTVRFTRHFESALTTMLERQHRGEPPAHFAVDAIAS